jgi:predicted TIM-barrel fold metal-dependent hydrolase
MDVPRIISVDDHVIEPPGLWQEHVPARYRDQAPRVERIQGRIGRSPRAFVYRPGAGDHWADCWLYEGVYYPIVQGIVAVSYEREELDNSAVLYDDMLPGCYDQTARLADMERNHTDASMCFPSFPRFCGQTFLEATDHDLALVYLETYNDWMVDVWCGGDATGRLIPITLVPLWDAELAAAEVRRCAAKGSHAIAFTESPPSLDLPSIYSGYWDPLWAACQETETVVNMHVGSSSTFPMTGKDSPMISSVALLHEGSGRALVDWLCSGVLGRFPTLRIALSEGQVGWIPFMLDRVDYAWQHHRGYGGIELEEPPSTRARSQVFGCIFDDVVGLEARERIGMDQIMFEVDYPHGDSTWPRSKERAEHLARAASLSEEELYKLVRGNAIECYGLERFGITV